MHRIGMGAARASAAGQDAEGAHKQSVPRQQAQVYGPHLTRFTNSFTRRSQERAGMSYKSCSRSSWGGAVETTAGTKR